jgi:hypothetical protein
MTTLRFTAAAAVFVLAAAACEKNSEPAPPPPAAAPAAPPSTPVPAPSLKDLPEMPLAPWSGSRISAASIPRIYTDVWSVAENKSSCALLAPRGLSAASAAATPRKATFSGGWSVAYDFPQQRSAFGIAGSGSNAWDPDIYAKWPHNISWSDGSSAGYGPEAGTGPNWLAYVKIPGQQCLYNVWSKHGQSHLEQIIDSLRLVSADGDD